jgi:hypothetical protein
MKMKPEDKVFPSARVTELETARTEGIDLRAYIATAALQGILANIKMDSMYTPDPDCVATLAIRCADALIEKL